jgi:hypothetical protein
VTVLIKTNASLSSFLFILNNNDLQTSKSTLSSVIVSMSLFCYKKNIWDWVLYREIYLSKTSGGSRTWFHLLMRDSWRFNSRWKCRRVFRRAHMRKACTLKRLKKWFQACMIITYSYGNIPALLQDQDLIPTRKAWIPPKGLSNSQDCYSLQTVHLHILVVQ